MKLSNYVQTNKWKLIKTFFCYLTYFTIGGCGTLLGSSLLDLQIRLNVSFKQLSSLAPSQSIGFFIGGLISGFLNMCFGSDMVLSIAVFFAGASLILAPWFKQFYATYTCLLLSGFAQGILEIYLNTCILSTWDHEVSVYVQLLHGSFGLGSLLAPLLVKPFLLPLAQNETETQSDEVILGTLAPAFVVKSDLRMTKQAGANLVSGFWFCVTFCRVLFIVLVKCINERRVIIFNCTLSIIGLILMCIFPTHSQVITWISFILLAIGISPTFSSSLGLLQKYITVSDRYASFLFIFGAAGEAAYPWIVSKFMASLPKLFAYYIAVLSCISVVSVLSLPPICQKLFKFETKTTLNRLAPVK